MPFYNYDQNNSGGQWDFDNRLTHVVIIEADDAEAADNRAESFGIYFNGVSNCRDCSCCGDRWYHAFGEGDEEPMCYGIPVSEVPEGITGWKPFRWRKDGPEIFVYRAHSTIPEPYWIQEETQ